MTFHPQILRQCLTVTSIALTLLLSPAAALADTFDEQIAVLRQQAAQQQLQAAYLYTQADGYRTQVAKMQAQVAYLQSQIAVTGLKSQKVSAHIADAEAKMTSQKAVQAENIRTMYLDAGTTPLEMLVSSSNLGDFFDQQMYQEKIKDQVIASMSSINELKSQLETDRANLQNLLADQQVQQQQARQQQAEANNLLGLASQNAAAADQSVRTANSQISSLKAQQAAALAAKFGSNIFSGGVCGGGYPGKWCNAAQDSLVDNWGMYNRECVSYTAFKVWESGRTMPYWGGRGNANQWPANARAAGYRVDSSPKVGDVAVSMLGPYGHVMYVESVVSGDKILASQYNFRGNGEYSTMTISTSGLSFIHF